MGEGEQGYRNIASLVVIPRGPGTPEVKIASVPVLACTGNKMTSSNLQIREEEQLLIGQNPLKLLEIGA